MATEPSPSAAEAAAVPPGTVAMAVTAAAEQPAPAVWVEMAKVAACSTSAPSHSAPKPAHSRPTRPTVDSVATVARVETAA